jgi:hypothetical protein
VHLNVEVVVQIRLELVSELDQLRLGRAQGLNVLRDSRRAGEPIEHGAFVLVAEDVNWQGSAFADAVNDSRWEGSTLKELKTIPRKRCCHKED